MTSLFNKLNLGDHREILVTNAPPSFEPELKALSGVKIFRDAKGPSHVQFGMSFVQTLKEVQTVAKTWLPTAKGDAAVWLAYPKGSSKMLKCEFNRDTGFTAIMDHGFDTVRIVSIDSDWSALRFRRVEFIKRAK